MATWITHVEEMKKERRKAPLFPFDPESNAKKAWDSIIILMLLVTTFTVPYFLVFGEETDPSAPLTSFQIVDTIFDVFFCVDILASFCTCYLAHRVYVTDMRLIARHYFTGWFWIDAPGSIPFDKIVIYTMARDGSAPNNSSVLRALKFIRVLKLIRVIRFMKDLDRLEDLDRTGSLRVLLKTFRALFSMMFTAHFFACMFVLLRNEGQRGVERRKGGLFGENNWMDAYNPELQNEEDGLQYQASLYWALVTIGMVGFGDILPVNHAERAYVVCVIVIGVVVFTFAMVNITSLFDRTRGVRLKFDARMGITTDYMEFRRFKPDLKRRVLAYFAGTWRESGALFEELNMLSQLPTQIRKIAYEHISVQALNAVPFLSGQQLDVMGRIFVMLLPRYFLEGEAIYKLHELGGDMYFIHGGAVKLSVGSRQYAPENNRFSIYRPQDLAKVRIIEAISPENFFGHLSLFHEVSKMRTEDANAQNKVEVLLLTRDMIDEIQGFCPDFYQRLFDFCRLSAACYGVNNSTSADSLIHGRPPSKIDRMCAELRSELLARHKQILVRPAKRPNKDDVALPLYFDGKDTNNQRDQDVREWLVMKKLNHVETSKRIIRIDMRRLALDNLDPSSLEATKTENSKLFPAKSKSFFGKSPAICFKTKKMFPVSKIKYVEPFRSAGSKNLKVTISWHLKEQADYELQFQNADAKEEFLSSLAFAMRLSKNQSTDLRRTLSSTMLEIRGPPTLARSASVPKEAEQDTWFECYVLFCAQTRTLMHEWPEGGRVSPDMWKRGIFAISDALKVTYMIDETGYLAESRPKFLGFLLVNESNIEQTCRVWRRQKFSLGKLNGLTPCLDPKLDVSAQYTSGCMFLIRNGSEIKRIYTRSESKRKVHSIQTSIARVASIYSENFAPERRESMSLPKLSTALEDGVPERRESTSLPKLPTVLGDVLKQLCMFDLYASKFKRTPELMRRLRTSSKEDYAVISRRDFVRLGIPLGDAIKIWRGFVNALGVKREGAPEALSLKQGTQIAGEIGCELDDAEFEKFLQEVMFEIEGIREDLYYLRGKFYSSRRASDAFLDSVELKKEYSDF